MIDHMTLTVSNLDRSIDFYNRALGPLGYGVTMRFEDFVGIGTKRKPFFWIKPGPFPTQPMHIAFVARSRGDVEKFHREALAAGARDNGPPGLRPDYHPNYFGAFVIGPDGHNLEAVCHDPVPAARSRKKARPTRARRSQAASRRRRAR